MNAKIRLPHPATLILLAGLVLALSPTGVARAGAVYVPVLDAAATNGAARTTEVLIANGDAATAFYGTMLPADTDGTQRGTAPPATPIAAGATLVLRSPSPPPPVGMFEVDAPATVAVGARVRPANGPATTLPVVSSQNMAAAGTTLAVLGLTRSAEGVASDLAVVNLAPASAHCQIAVFRTDGSQIRGTATVTLVPLSLRLYRDALAMLGEQQLSDARATVSCDQPFYTFGALVDGGAGLAFLLPAATGASTLVRPTPAPPPPPPPGAAVVFALDGLVHAPSPGNEVRVLTVPVPGQLAVRVATVDLDFTPGPWNTRKVPGVHGLVWLYRGRFRSGTIANVSAVNSGGDSSSLRMNQNVDLPAGSNRSNSAAYRFVEATTYHLRYTYDAEANRVTLVLTQGSQTLRTVTMEGTAANNVLNVAASGLVAQLGNYGSEGGPEVASYGWQYSNLRISLTPYS